MKKQLLSLTIIAGMVASASAATILTDFSTAAGTAGNTPLTESNVSISLSGSTGELTYKANSLTSTTDIRRAPAGSAITSTIAYPQNNTGNLGGVFSLTYTVGAANVEISAITLKSGFFNGGNGTFQTTAGSANIAYTLTFKNSSDVVLATWTGTQTYTGGAANNAMLTTVLTGTSFNAVAGSDLKLEIQGSKAAGAPNGAGFIGIDSVSMTANAVPEPATAGLGLLGLGALMLRRRRK